MLHTDINLLRAEMKGGFDKMEKTMFELFNKIDKRFLVMERRM
jgi:hypothetical protein